MRQQKKYSFAPPRCCCCRILGRRHARVHRLAATSSRPDGLLHHPSSPALLCTARRRSRLRHVAKVFVVLSLAAVPLEVPPEKHGAAAQVVAFRALHPRPTQRIRQPAHQHVQSAPLRCVLEHRPAVEVPHALKFVADAQKEHTAWSGGHGRIGMVPADGRSNRIVHAGDAYGQLQLRRERRGFCIGALLCFVRWRLVWSWSGEVCGEGGRARRQAAASCKIVISAAQCHQNAPEAPVAQATTADKRLPPPSRTSERKQAAFTRASSPERSAPCSEAAGQRSPGAMPPIIASI